MAEKDERANAGSVWAFDGSIEELENCADSIAEHTRVSSSWVRLRVKGNGGLTSRSLHLAYQLLTNASFAHLRGDSGVSVALGAAEGGPQSRIVEQPLFDTVAVGGTFDRLHAGHKNLLSTAALHARSTVIVGVTDASMHREKRHASLVEPWTRRAAAASAFLARFAPSVRVIIVPLTDAFGAAVDGHRQIDAIAVTEETVPGATAINERRSALGLSRLHVLITPMISVQMPDGTHDKLSSTILRSFA